MEDGALFLVSIVLGGLALFALAEQLVGVVVRALTRHREGQEDAARRRRFRA